MGLPIGEVVVLVAPHAVGDFVVQPLGHAVVAVGMFGCHGGGAHVHLGTHGPKHVHLLLALLAVGRADEAVALHDARQREPHSRVARGAFNHRATRLQLARGLGRFNHGQGHAVFHAVSRIEVLHFGPNRTGEFLGNRIQANHRGVANRPEDVVVHVHGSKSSFRPRVHDPFRPLPFML